MAITNVTDRDFGRQVLERDEPVVVAFRASWCAPSAQLAPMVDELAANFDKRVKVVALDVDSDPKLNSICRRYNVTRLPMTMVFRNGRVADFVAGQASIETLVDMVHRQLRPLIDVDEFNFDVEVLKSPIPVLVHVDARWCDASLRLVPEVDAAATRLRGRAKVVRLEWGGANSRLCAQYQFRRVPIIALFSDGRIQDQIYGAMEGGTKDDITRTSCVGLTTAENIDSMLDAFAH